MLALVVLIGFVLWHAGDLARRIAIRDVRAQAEYEMTVHAASLESKLDRYRVMPHLLAESPDIISALRGPDVVPFVHAANSFLQGFNELIQASDSYVLDRQGVTIAASNWQRSTSFVGRGFAYRPYFQAAMEGREGLFTGLGTTSQRRGFYFSSPIRIAQEVAGVAVVKVDLQDLELAWSRGPTRLFVTDAQGVIFLSNHSDWLFRTLAPLDIDDLRYLAKTRKYASIPVAELPVVKQRELPGSITEISITDRELNRAGKRSVSTYLMFSQALTGTPWTLFYLVSNDTVARTETTTVTRGLFVVAFLSLCALFFAQRYRYQSNVRKTLQRAHDELEARVQERTTDLQTTNRRLRHEISERERAEEEAQQAREEVIQAGKLAALGQLSAGITHELNQPLSAIRAYSDNARVFLERGRYAAVSRNLKLVSELTEHAAAIVEHLKVFARKTSDELEPVSINRVIEHALALFAPRLRKEGIQVTTHGTSEETFVHANAIRLEQVLVNLLSNACDALLTAEKRCVSLTLSKRVDWVDVTIEDSGPGITEEALLYLFDPFFTTKEVGRGLGLGLSISYGIVNRLGGSIRAENRPEGGALFCVQLPALAKSPDEIDPESVHG